MKTRINPPGLVRAASVLLAIPLLAVALSAQAQCPPRSAQDFDGVTPPALPAGWVASQGVNVTGAPPWVTSNVASHTWPNDAFSIAPDNILDNRLDTPLFNADPFGFAISFQNNYNLESGRDGAVLEISSPNINGGAFTDITDPAVGGSVSPGYNSLISSAFQSPIAGRMAWSGNSGGYVTTQVFLGNAAFPPSQAKLRFRVASDNSGASAGWRIDSLTFLSNECPSPTPSPTPCPVQPWTSVADYPLPVIEQSAVGSNGSFAYSAGGYTFPAETNAFYRYDPAANSWTLLPPLPANLSAARGVYAPITNSFYVFGGLTQSQSTVLDTTYIYNVGTNTWSTGAPMPAARYFPNVAYYGGKIFVIGGHTGSSEASQTWEYDPVANTWNTLRADIPVAMGGSATGVVEHFIDLISHLNGGAGSTLHYRYDISLNTWTLMAPAPAIVYEPMGGTIGRQVHVVGGLNPAQHTGTYTYNTDNNTWTTGPETNVSHSYAGGTAIGSRLLIVGGYLFGSADTNLVETAIISCAPTPSPTPPPTPSPTATPSATATATVSPTATPTASDCPGFSCASPSATPPATATPTPSPTGTPSPPALGNYPAATALLSIDTIVTPDAAPVNTTGINVFTSTNFKGTLEGDPVTGVVRVTNAHPAGIYTVTVKAFGSGGSSANRTFPLSVSTPVTCTAVNFAAATNFSVGFSPASVALGDFNGDGKQDLVVANSAASNVSILLGDGAGSFIPAANASAGTNPRSVAVGDFNGDGKQDLAVANAGSNNVSILLGNGGGSFSPATNFNTGDNPVKVAVGDFNGDGKQDLAVANAFGNVSILLGDGAGSFGPATDVIADATPVSVAVGDFNGDGQHDLAVTNYLTSNVSILLGNGSGSFGPATNFSVGSSPLSAAVGDFNGDGKQDLAVANSGSGYISILLGDGTGSFSPAPNVLGGTAPSSVAVGDFNGDGKQDLVVGNENSSNVSILLGDGSGSFSPATNFGAGNVPLSVAVGDFNSDGKQDVVVVNPGTSKVSILLRDCLTPTRALNISTRLRVETGESVAIGGFIVTGSAPKKVAIRGIGPSLGNSGLSDLLADPTLELRGSDGALLVQNDNWQDDPAQAAQLIALGLALQNSSESGIVATLQPGAYTAILAGKNQTSGLGLVEIYDVDAAAPSQLANISTRGYVRTADNVMIGGFILQGDASIAVAVRGIGPSLGQSGLTDVLADPTLELHDGNGALLIGNDNWQDDAVSAAQLSAHGLAPPNALESGVFITLPPGVFTATLAGKNGGVGIGLVEVYGGVGGGTLTANSTADSGAGSLRDTIAVAGNGDTIQFDAALNGQTIGLTSGELVVDKNITISGPGPNLLSVSKGSSSPQRIFHVMPGHTVTIEGLTVTSGFTQESGGGIFNDGATLTLNNCAVVNNFGGLSGGGIYNSGAGATLTIVNSTISRNVLPVGEEFQGSGNGAGIFNNGTLAIDHSTVSGNYFYDFNPPRPQLGGDGGGIYSAGGTLTISNSTISGNSANLSAGGVFNGGTSEIINSTISVNGAMGGGGGIANSGTLTVDHSILRGNTAYFKWFGTGGGISNGGTMELRNSTLSGNRVDGGGGAIDNSGEMTIANSTLTDNFSIHTKTLGGGSLRNESGTVQIGNTIINSGSSDANFNNSATVISHGYNLSSDNGGGLLTATGDQINTDPILGPLQDNGGPTFTHALLTGSPAINAGDPNFTPPPLYDQRGPGYDRVVGERIDIGSFEVQP